MAAMVWPLMGRIIKSTMGCLLWTIRIVERWLERFDDKTVPLKEDQLPNENRQGSVNIPGEPETIKMPHRFSYQGHRKAIQMLLHFRILLGSSILVHCATVNAV